MDNDDLRTLARKRLKATSDFKNFLLVLLGVSVILIVVWVVSGTDSFWPGWAIGGMGIAAFFMAIDVYGPGRSIVTEDAVDAEVAEVAEVQRITKKSRPPGI